MPTSDQRSKSSNKIICNFSRKNTDSNSLWKEAAFLISVPVIGVWNMPSTAPGLGVKAYYATFHQCLHCLPKNLF